jgi:hypothetical protein
MESPNIVGSSFTKAILITIVLTGVFTALLAQADLQAIRNDWTNRRCDISSILLASFLKPSDDSRSSMEFSKDNFNFCSDKIVDNVLKSAFAPLYSILGKQVDSLNTMNQPLNNIRGMIRKNVWEPFAKVLDKQFRQFSLIQATLHGIWARLRNIMQRISATVFSTLYIGLSINVLIQNLFQFIFKVILIILGVMVALIILLFFVLFPFIPMIVSVIAIIGAVLGGAAVSGMAGAFCVDPEVYVKLANGKNKKLNDIEIGDILSSKSADKKNIVTGILKVNANDIDLCDIKGILMSGSHRVKYLGTWILAREHPDAIRVYKKLDYLICLNTTTHEVPIISSTGEIVMVGDWEEVDTEEGQRAWISMVNLQINKSVLYFNDYPTAVPLVSPKIKVMKEGIGFIPISKVKIGDFILSKQNQYTRVTGIYRGILETMESIKDPEWISDGVWIQRTAKFWSTTSSGIRHENGASNKLYGIFLITESETFMIERRGSLHCVRDFTEIGASNIEKTYDILDIFINKK